MILNDIVQCCELRENSALAFSCGFGEEYDQFYLEITMNE